MIKTLVFGQERGGVRVPSSQSEPFESIASAATPLAAQLRDNDKSAQLRALMAEHFAFVWRSLRRLGVRDGQLDDAAQQVWIIVSQMHTELRVETARALLFAVALRVASDARRTLRRRREVTAEVQEPVDEQPGPDELVDRKRSRAILDDILDTMSDDVRAVFVLFELDQMSMAEIANIVDAPMGTVASRLRRGRELFEQEMKRVRARETFHTGGRR
ncbi:MAG: polymerase sigma factor RpoE [Labilithrix sp.]|nr:polymerase sigma factor RpoE [Labilithrix sp.]